MKFNYYELFLINKCYGFLNLKKNISILLDYIIYNNSIILKIEFCGEKKFSYNLNKNYKGYFVFIFFYSSSIFIGNIFQFLKKNKNIIRFLIISLKRNNNFFSNYFYNKLHK